VSRLFAHYQAEDVIQVDRRRVSILNMQRLKEIVGECKSTDTSAVKN